MSTLQRQTRETQVSVRLARASAAGGSGANGSPTEPHCLAETGQPFFDHMLATLGRYADLELEVRARGDLKHHLIEDVAITLGQALRDEVPETCARYGSATVVMDDALVQVALDAGGRPYYEGPVPSHLYDHFFRSFADNAALTLHVVVLRGRDRHHAVEAAVKALGLALRTALAPGVAIFSTKGAVRFGREEA